MVAPGSANADVGLVVVELEVRMASGIVFNSGDLEGHDGPAATGLGAENPAAGTGTQVTANPDAVPVRFGDELADLGKPVVGDGFPSDRKLVRHAQNLTVHPTYQGMFDRVMFAGATAPR